MLNELDYLTNSRPISISRVLSKEIQGTWPSKRSQNTNKCSLEEVFKICLATSINLKDGRFLLASHKQFGLKIGSSSREQRSHHQHNTLYARTSCPPQPHTAALGRHTHRAAQRLLNFVINRQIPFLNPPRGSSWCHQLTCCTEQGELLRLLGTVSPCFIFWKTICVDANVFSPNPD